MKVEETAAGGREFLALCGLLTSREVLAAVAPRWKRPKLRSPWASLVGDWAVDHYKKHGEPLGRGVQAAYARWSAANTRPGEADLVHEFLARMSEEWERDHDRPVAAPALLIETANELLDESLLADISEQLAARLAARDIKGGLQVARGFNESAPLSGNQARRALKDPDRLVREAFSSTVAESLVPYTGALGEFLAGEMARDRFVAFLGAEKSGKSMHLQNAAALAVADRRKVLYIEAGDLGLDGAVKRLYSRILRRPLESPKGWPYAYPRPIKFTYLDGDNSDGDEVDPDKARKRKKGDVPFEVEHEEVEVGHLDPDEIASGVTSFHKKNVRTKQECLHLMAFPAATVSMADIAAYAKSILKERNPDDERGEEDLYWVPDVIIIDYMDILAPMPGTERLDLRHQINATWTAARRLSQELNCLILSATQADTASYGRPYLTRSNFSNSKTINAHVTALLGLAALDDELEYNVTRLNYVVRRHGPCYNNAVMFLAGCPAEVTPTYLSSGPHRV